MNRSMPRITPDKPLGGRYKIISQLGVGGFGRTFLADDLHLPGHPRCVIKHLKPQSKSDETLQMARRCFDVEAQVLYHLGSHDQIPRLLAHFEEAQEFYLAQEFIEGEPLTRELANGKPWLQGRVVVLVKDILQVLTFVHQQQVIHRDIKPSNLIRRRQDRKIVVIDFGAVKQVSKPGFDPDTGLTNLTISIGTQGYMPNEQLAGKPKFCSDVYAVGVLAIQMLTGIHPRHFGETSNGEIAWHDCISPQFPIHPELIEVLDRMVRYDFRERYVDAAAALLALESLPDSVTEVGLELDPVPETIRLDIPAGTSGISGTNGTNGISGTAMQAATSPQVVTSQQVETASSFSSSFSRPSIELSRDKIIPDDEPISTAVWLSSGSMSPAMPSGTGLTQAVGRPHLTTGNLATDTTVARSNSWSKRLFHPWAIVGLLSVSLLAALLQTQLPFASQKVIDPNAKGGDPTRLIEPDPNLSPAEQAAVYVKEARDLQDQKEFQQAIQAYDQAIAVQPNDAEAHAGRCEAFNQLEQPEDAIVSCNDALAYRPNYPEALWSLGNARLLQKRPYDALKLYEDVTEKQPDFAPGWVKRGVALQALGRSAEALVALDQAIKLERDSAEAWVTKGEALLNLQRYDAALTALTKAVQLQPNDPVAVQLKQKAREKAQ
jgi:eukaryotic-like serine/threonine-protein kinase